MGFKESEDTSEDSFEDDEDEDWFGEFSEEACERGVDEGRGGLYKKSEAHKLINDHIVIIYNLKNFIKIGDHWRIQRTIWRT